LVAVAFASPEAALAEAIALMFRLLLFSVPTPSEADA